MKKLEVLAENMSNEGATTALREIEHIVADYITEKGLRRLIKIKEGK